MNATNNPIKGVLVLAGLLDPTGDIGTQCRFDLLPIPWDKAEFAAHVSNMIRFDLSAKARIEYQAKGFPEALDDTEALSRGIGLRAWLRVDVSGQKLMGLLVDGWSNTRGELAAKEIDHLSFNVPSIIFKWPHSNPNDDTSINQFESALLSQLDSSA